MNARSFKILIDEEPVTHGGDLVNMVSYLPLHHNCHSSSDAHVDHSRHGSHVWQQACQGVAHYFALVGFIRTYRGCALSY